MIDDADAGRGGGGRLPTFTSWLRNLSDTELAALFEARPDLITPVPADIAALAARAVSRPAVLRVLDRLDRFTLCVLEGLVALGDDRASATPGVGRDRLAAALDVPDKRLDEALSRLHGAALVWVDGDGLRPVSVLRDVLTRPAGLGPPLRVLLGGLPTERLNRIAADLGLPTGYTAGTDAPDGAGDPASRIAAAATPELLTARIAEAGPQAREVLDRLTWGPPDGTVSGAAARDVDAATATSPVDRLLARGLLVATAADTVTLPLEVGLVLREGRLFQRVATDPPPLTGARVDPDRATRAAAGQAFTVIRSIEELLERWAEDPPGVLRSGGLGVRDLRRAAQSLDTDEPTAALLIETAHAAGLLAADAEVGGEWLPTPGYDLWRRSAPERRWLRLAEAWLRTTRVAALSASADTRGRSRSVLGEGLDRRSAPEIRREVLHALAAAPAGTAPTPEAVVDVLAWLRPRRQGQSTTELIDVALREAALLGLTGRGAIAPHTQALLAESADDDTPVAERDHSRAAELLATELPTPLTHILVQGDLTAVAPGPLVPDLARELALAADVESTGGATVYRFTDASLRRALDAGRGAADITALLERHSQTPLPQALRYLIDDVARRHGRLRVGTASSYLRCDEPSVLDELLGDRRTGDLMLVRLAPTVIASRAARATLLERLNELGYHPVPEDGSGAVRLSGPEARRAEERSLARELDEPAPVGPTLRMAAVRAVRAGDEAATAVRHPIPAPDAAPPRSATAATLAALTAATEKGRRVWIGYLDTDGRASSRIVEPARVDGGYMTGYDATRAAVHRFAVHRITGVADLDAARQTAPLDASETPGDGQPVTDSAGDAE
ncbi:helicase [Nocardiopsis gilva YIM 90087]|uniref:Helicase n=1 Tax=Nocardiopsis gilva YIM 90087 TaxID=1235441 RepID=A0A223S286_9ACTN|nr:helicase-associated domain-containing protein [Nocardiopsis gilva]ASU82250.1 helicase [Nocardiopsis gilva YIM 90087]